MAREKDYALVLVVRAPARATAHAVWHRVAQTVHANMPPVRYLGDPFEIDGLHDEYATREIVLLGDEDRALTLVYSALDALSPAARVTEELTELQRDCNYNPEADDEHPDGGVDALIAYKDALEDRLYSMAHDLEEAADDAGWEPE